MAPPTTPTTTTTTAEVINAQAGLIDADVLSLYPPQSVGAGAILIVPAAPIPTSGNPISKPTVYVAFSPDGKTQAWAKLAAAAIDSIVPANLP